MDLFQSLPEFQFASWICSKLNEKGHLAYLAGGCVRDFLMGRMPKDFDVATSATPDEIEKIFPKTLSIGKSFGVIHVLSLDQPIQIEVATFRQDGEYQDGRRPLAVAFSSAKEDAFRRDLTINALFYDLSKHQVIDYCDGQQDIKEKKIRTVGEARLRFQEDHLRILRALRFVSQLDFVIEDSTYQAICQQKEFLTKVSGERIQEELTKLLGGQHRLKTLRLLFESEVIHVLVYETKSYLMEWKDPQSFFKFIYEKQSWDSSDLWFGFLSWILAMEKSTEPDLTVILSLMDRWKFSNKLKKELKNSFDWLLHNNFSEIPLGSILENSFQAGTLRGILARKEWQSDKDSQKEKKILGHLIHFSEMNGPTKPVALVQASDLMPYFTGVALGQALQFCYWYQLEFPEMTKAALLAKLRKESHGNE